MLFSITAYFPGRGIQKKIFGHAVLLDWKEASELKALKDDTEATHCHSRCMQTQRERETERVGGGPAVAARGDLQGPPVLPAVG